MAVHTAYTRKVTARGNRALRRYEALTHLADGSQAPGKRIALGLDVCLATKAGRQRFDRAIIEAIQNTPYIR